MTDYMKEEQRNVTDCLDKGQDIEMNLDGSMGDVDDVDSGESEVSALETKMLLLQADFDNFRKRVARDRDEYQKYACASLMSAMFPVLDVFEIGFKSVDQADPAVSGFAMAFNQLKSILKNNGLEEILPSGAKFDPTIHEAVSHVPSDQVPSDMIIEVVRTGYMLNGRLLRPAAVVVSSGKSEQE